VGAEISARITEELFADLLAPVERVGAKNAHIPFAPILERAVVPAAEEIVEAARRAVEYTRTPAHGSQQSVAR
jgi:pyruvate/2-oxoglutarate/acetoin dehydrogenase E1 component